MIKTVYQQYINDIHQSSPDYVRPVWKPAQVQVLKEFWLTIGGDLMIPSSCGLLFNLFQFCKIPATNLIDKRVPHNPKDFELGVNECD